MTYYYCSFVLVQRFPTICIGRPQKMFTKNGDPTYWNTKKYATHTKFEWPVIWRSVYNTIKYMRNKSWRRTIFYRDKSEHCGCTIVLGFFLMFDDQWRPQWKSMATPRGVATHRLGTAVLVFPIYFVVNRSVMPFSYNPKCFPVLLISNSDL